TTTAPRHTLPRGASTPTPTFAKSTPILTTTPHSQTPTSPAKQPAGSPRPATASTGGSHARPQQQPQAAAPQHTTHRGCSHPRHSTKGDPAPRPQQPQEA